MKDQLWRITYDCALEGVKETERRTDYILTERGIGIPDLVTKLKVALDLQITEFQIREATWLGEIMQ